MNNDKQIELIEKTSKKLEKSIKDLAKLKKGLAQAENPYTLDDIIDAVENRKYGYGRSLRQYII